MSLVNTVKSYTKPILMLHIARSHTNTQLIGRSVYNNDVIGSPQKKFTSKYNMQIPSNNSQMREFEK
jgi:hypothetical protein